MKINPGQRKQYGLETVLHLIPAVLHIKGWLRSTHEPAKHLNEELSLGFIDYLTNSTFGDHHNSTQNSRRGFVVSHNVQGSIGSDWDSRLEPVILPSNKGNLLAEVNHIWRPLTGWGPNSFLMQGINANTVRVLAENYIQKTSAHSCIHAYVSFTRTTPRGMVVCIIKTSNGSTKSSGSNGGKMTSIMS